MSQFNLDEKVQKVEYEGLQIICYQSGKYGHNSIVCPSKQKMNEANNVTSKNTIPVHTAGEKDGAVAMNTKNSEKFGPWMIVARKGKPKFVVERRTLLLQRGINEIIFLLPLGLMPYLRIQIQILQWRLLQRSLTLNPHNDNLNPLPTTSTLGRT